tara:strand:- start:2956 stop:3660 length:705 start_codon:yes stop_codon:yes gene_type:complete
MIYLFDYYKALLRVTTKQPKNYNLPELPEDICKYIFSFIERENARNIIYKNMHASIKSKVTHYCKLISEDKSVYQRYMKRLRDNSDKDTEPFCRVYGSPKQIISIVNDINTQACGIERRHILSSNQFKDYVHKIVNDVFEEEKDVWKYKWYDKEESIKFHEKCIENYNLDKTDSDEEAEEAIVPLVHNDMVLKNIILRSITWVTKDILDLEHSIIFGKIDYNKEVELNWSRSRT